MQNKLKNNDIKLLFKKIAAFIIPLYLLWFFYIEYFPLYYNRPTNTRWYFLKESLEGNYKIPKVNKIFLGESRLNAGLDYTKISGSYGFASGGSTPVEMYYVLKKYLKKYPKPDTVFLSVSPRFFCELFAFWHFAVRNNFISTSDFKEIISEKSMRTDVLGDFPRFKFFLYKADYLTYYQDDVLYNNVFSGYEENKKLIEKMQEMKGGRPHPGLKDSCSALNYETGYDNFMPDKLLVNYFDKILGTCKTNNIMLIFFSMPVNKSSFDALSPKFVSGYEKFMKKYANKYPGFIISDSLYAYPDKFFGDASHLNIKGRELFTEKFTKGEIFEF
ncbi:MAG: hypothetical protein GXO50_04055 [Chlorobi bacterium]|nr:hypothetical protein [Chlorobiota bacterium]